MSVRALGLSRGGKRATTANLRTLFTLALGVALGGALLAGPTLGCTPSSTDDDDDDDGGSGSGSFDWGDPSHDVDCATGGVYLNGGQRLGSVEEAVAASSSGDVLTLCPGTYPTGVEVEHELTLEGTGDPALTVLDGEGAAGSILATTGSFDLELARLTFANGRGTEQSSGATQGGAVLAPDASLVLLGVRFEDNAADYGSAIYSNAHLEGLGVVIVGGSGSSVQVGNSQGEGSVSLEELSLSGQVEDSCLVFSGVPVELVDTTIEDCPGTPLRISDTSAVLSGIEISGTELGASGGIELHHSSATLEQVVVSGGYGTGGGALTITDIAEQEVTVVGGALAGNTGREAAAAFLEFNTDASGSVSFTGVDFGDGGDSPTLSWNTVNGSAGQHDLSGVTDLSCDRLGCE